jgi:hypothetical protein
VTKVGEDPPIDYKLVEIYRAAISIEFWFFRFEIRVISPWTTIGELINIHLAAEPSGWSDIIQAELWEVITIPVRDPRGTICLQGTSGTKVIFDLWLRLDQLTAGKDIP